jgi:hypothetical protein
MSVNNQISNAKNLIEASKEVGKVYSEDGTFCH